MSMLETMGEICQPAACIHGEESQMAKVHRMIHDACFELDKGNLQKAQQILAEADQIAYDVLSPMKCR